MALAQMADQFEKILSREFCNRPFDLLDVRHIYTLASWCGASRRFNHLPLTRAWPMFQHCPQTTTGLVFARMNPARFPFARPRFRGVACLPLALVLAFELTAA